MKSFWLSLREVYGSAGFRLKEEDINEFVGLKMNFLPNAELEVSQRFWPSEPLLTTRFKHGGGNCTMKRKVVTVAGQIVGCADRCMFSSLKACLITLFNIFGMCGYNENVLKGGAEIVLATHAYLKDDIVVALVESKKWIEYGRSLKFAAKIIEADARKYLKIIEEDKKNVDTNFQNWCAVHAQKVGTFDVERIILVQKNEMSKEKENIILRRGCVKVQKCFIKCNDCLLWRCKECFEKGGCLCLDFISKNNGIMFVSNETFRSNCRPNLVCLHLHTQ